MSIKRRGLGRGLDALLPAKRDGAMQQVDVNLLKPSPQQPRKAFDPEAIAELARSIASKGVLQPLLLRPLGEGYEIIAGERRYRAALEAGLSTVPAIVRELSEQEALEIAIVENLQREDLSPLEEARAFEQLLSFGLSQEELADVVGKSRSAVANTLRLLKLPPRALLALERGEISAGHARAILAQPEADQDWALEQILGLGLSVRQAERLKRPAGERLTSERPSLYEQIEHSLAEVWGTRVRIVGERKGKVELHFYSRDDLDRLLELLNYRT